MNPIIGALAAHPAVGAFAQQLVQELTPVLRRGLRHVRPGFFAPALAPSLLVSCFAAGVAVGWFTAPRKGVVMRRKVVERVETWYGALSRGAQAKRHDVLAWARSHEGHRDSDDGEPRSQTH